MNLSILGGYSEEMFFDISEESNSPTEEETLSFESFSLLDETSSVIDILEVRGQTKDDQSVSPSGYFEIHSPPPELS